MNIEELKQENEQLKNALKQIADILNKECGIISNAKAVGLINDVLK